MFDRMRQIQRAHLILFCPCCYFFALYTDMYGRMLIQLYTESMWSRPTQYSPTASHHHLIFESKYNPILWALPHQKWFVSFTSVGCIEQTIISMPFKNNLNSSWVFLQNWILCDKVDFKHVSFITHEFSSCRIGCANQSFLHPSGCCSFQPHETVGKMERMVFWNPPFGR